MKRSLIIGNDINNVTNTTSWDNLLKEIIQICVKDKMLSKNTPFPILYEEIYLNGLKDLGINEYELKKAIARIVNEIVPNEIHEELIQLDIKNYLTTNYDYVLEKILLGKKNTDTLKNKGIIKESKYNVFRHNTLGEKQIWHLHGEANAPNSITLGFEHYGGQLQQLRNYVVSGTNYKNTEVNNLGSLHRRLRKGEVTENVISWIDLLFRDEVHILGLGLGFEETDLWWLLTNRVRFQNQSEVSKNKIIYYSPSKYKDVSKDDLMKAFDIEVKYINIENKGKYYKEAVKIIRNGL